ncbi:MAG: aminotransferase class I/II-fold pyridoxal phosphate-dependent enzyme [Methylococcaceae bacterium]|nr:aminotransferase class I/II-fold pyridoxal phosphate-dependent enzyme [Methylococcaceae bacterium]
MKNLVFDVSVILDLWLKRVSSEQQHIIAGLLVEGENNGHCCWVSSSSLPVLELISCAELKKSGMAPSQAGDAAQALIAELMSKVKLLSNYSFNQTDALQIDNDLEDAQMVMAASALHGLTAIVTNDKRLKTGDKLDQVSPIEVAKWLQAKGENQSIDFIDLKTQQDAIRPQLEQNIYRVLEHGQYIMGPEVAQLEQRLVDYTGAKYCITVASGTEALLISLMALGIKPGDEVITTPFTFAATVEVIVLLGIKPVFVDIEPDTCNINASLIEAKITANTKAIMPVSLYGQVPDMDEINAIAAKYNLSVIEDAAQSFGAMYKTKKSCNVSTIACTSFFPSKPLGCYGDGGAIFTSDEALAQACREIRVHGQSKRYTHTRVGVGGRMDTLQCAVILAKFDRFEWEVQQRLKIGQRYNELIDQQGIKRVKQRADRNSVFAQYTVFVEGREALQQKLNAVGVPTAVHYPIPMNFQPAYQHLCCPDCTPNATVAGKQVMSLPMGADLAPEQQGRIIDALKTHYQQASQ